MNYLSREPKLELAKKLKVVIWVLTVVVLGLVGMMRRVKLSQFDGMFDFLPAVHAGLNTLVAIFLIVALVVVKMKKITLHKGFMNAAMVTSTLFLLCYVLYHFTTPETLFGDYDHDGTVTDIEKQRAGGVRTAYFFILITHIILAAVSLPLILFTWMFGMTNQFNKHRKMAKFVYPIWLYVAVTGPVCYFMLKPFYE